MNIQDVARRAGVSTATVSRAFGTPDKVSPETRERVERAARDLGYIPNSSARVLRTRRSHVVGVVLPTLLNPVFAECLDGIAPAAQAHGYAILPVTTDYRIEKEEEAVSRLIASNVEGLVMVVSNPAQSRALDLARTHGVPYVLVYNRHAQHPCVTVDNEAAVRDVVKRLVRSGHRRIAMVAGQLVASDRAQQRYRGYLAALGDHGLKAPELIEVPFMSAAIEKVSQHLQRKQRASALICSNDLLALRCLRATHECGIAVPAQLSVVGFDGIALGLDLTPQLTTIVQPNRVLGEQAVDLLAGAISRGLPLAGRDSRILDYTLRQGESARLTLD